jgi:invasion protein IalB
MCCIKDTLGTARTPCSQALRLAISINAAVSPAYLKAIGQHLTLLLSKSLICAPNGEFQMKALRWPVAAIMAGAIGFSSVGFAQQPTQRTPAQTVAPSRPAPPPAAPNPPAAPAADSGQPPPPGWVTRCSSLNRQSPLDCAVEQTAVLTRTGQLVVLFSVRVPGNTRQPMAFLQLPLGLSLAQGVKLQVDDGKVLDLPLQTCEAQGCFAAAPIAADLLGEMRRGKQLKVIFQNLSREPITIPMSLAEFSQAYDRVQ